MSEGAETSSPASVDEDMVQEAEELKSVPALVLPSKEVVEAHNVSHLPFRSWCSACVGGRGLSLGYHKVDAKTKEAEQIPTVSVDYGFFGQLEDRAHDTLPVRIVRNRKSKGIWSHPVPSKGVVHPYLARALMSDLDFMEYRRIVLKSDQQPSIVALCDAVKNGWHGEIVREASPKCQSKSNGEVECAVSICAGTGEDPQRLLGAEIWDCDGVPESAVGLAGRALFQPSPIFPQR